MFEPFKQTVFCLAFVRIRLRKRFPRLLEQINDGKKLWIEMITRELEDRKVLTLVVTAPLQHFETGVGVVKLRRKWFRWMIEFDDNSIASTRDLAHQIHRILVTEASLLTGQ